MNDIQINGKWVGLPKIMKLKNFEDYIGYYIRKFTKMYVEENQLFIGHAISNRKMKIEFPDLDYWIKYFDRI